MAINIKILHVNQKMKKAFSSFQEFLGKENKSRGLLEGKMWISPPHPNRMLNQSQIIFGAQDDWNLCMMNYIIADTSKNCAPYEARTPTSQDNQCGFLFQSYLTDLFSWFSLLHPKSYGSLSTRKSSTDYMAVFSMVV